MQLDWIPLIEKSRRARVNRARVTSLKHVLLVAGAGALGASLRYLTTLSVIRYWPSAPYVGTVTVNLLGCFAFGALFQASESAGWWTPETRLFLLTGFLGAFTTFSTFAFETVQLFESRGFATAAAYLLVQNVLGVALVVGGMGLGKSLA